MKAFTTLLALASAVSAHMVMKTPKPANVMGGPPNNSPLDASGSDYPCKMAGGGALDTSNPNIMTIGSTNTLSFTGSAVHGGGSCQVSLAKTTTVSKDMKFMVIHSIEGGCPADVSGNLPADPNGNGANQFQFTIPDHPDLGPGDYTLAWTWNNKIGNREFYMNCAYVQLQGAAKKRYAPSPPVSKRDQAPLPDMFVANIGNGCSTAEGIDVKYPAPGSSLEVGAGANLGDPTGSCGATGASEPSQPNTGGSSSAASPQVPSTPSAPGFATATNSVSPVQSSSPGFPSGQPGNPNGPGGQRTQTNGGSFATVTGGGAASPSQPAATQSAPAASATAVAPNQPATPATSASVPIGTGTSGSSPSTGSPGGGSCTEGNWKCAADGKSFQRCASGSWSVSMPMSAGLTCVPGESSTFSYNVSGGGSAKRDLRSHISRRRHAAYGPFIS